MPMPSQPSDPCAETARALAAPSMLPSARLCPICETPLTGRQQACSNRCRAALSRRRRIAVRREELVAMRGRVQRLLEDLWEVKADLERALGG